MIRLELRDRTPLRDRGRHQLTEERGAQRDKRALRRAHLRHRHSSRQMVGGLEEGKVAQRLLRWFQGELGAQRGHRVVPIAQDRDASRSASSLASRVPDTTRRRRWGCLNKFPLVCRFRRTRQCSCAPARGGRGEVFRPRGGDCGGGGASGRGVACLLSKRKAVRRAPVPEGEAHRRPRAALGQAFDELV